MKKMQVYILFLLLIGTVLNSYGQEQKKQQQNFYRRTLGVDSLKAEKVSNIQESYKIELKTLIADTSLNEVAKQAKINVLVEQKNKQLRTLLSPAQQEKIIPSTERKLTSGKAAINQ
jgi:hypothetical protein